MPLLLERNAASYHSFERIGREDRVRVAQTVQITFFLHSNYPKTNLVSLI